MKKLIFAGIILTISIVLPVQGQIKPGITRNQVNSLAAGTNADSATRVRVLGRETVARTDANRLFRPSAPSTASASPFKARLASTGAAGPAANVSAALTQLYRVGIGDILDIQIIESQSRQSTLFTVQDGGLLDYPLAGQPLPVAGMTTGEVAQLLKRRIKYFSNPSVAVKVRDYSSHSVTINGFVAAPGVKVLRREAVPLYTVLSEALPLPEAAYATITRDGRSSIVVDLSDGAATASLVVPEDVIRISAQAPAMSEFFFVGGEVNSPGQKAFHSGLTLTQAILASGGLSRNAGTVVRLSRQGGDGRLLIAEYNLSNIQNGLDPDPALNKGDRIEVKSR